MFNNDFKTVDAKFATLQTNLEYGNHQKDTLALILLNTLLENKYTIILKNADDELKKIRDFYQERFYSATNIFSRSQIIKKYEELYTILYKLTQNEITAEQASNDIKKNTKVWKNELILNNVVNVCLAIAWTLPLIAGIALLPFALPLLSLTLPLGLAVLTAALSSIYLSVSQIYNNLSSIQSTSSIVENGALELTFFGKLNSINRPEASNTDKLEEEEEQGANSSMHTV